MTVGIRHLAALGLSLVAGAAWLGAGTAHAAAPPTTCDGPGIRVLVNDQTTGGRSPLAGVRVVVNDASGTALGEGTTNDKGIALICVTEKADVVVVLDTSSLPTGKALQAGASNETVVGKDTWNTAVKTITYFTGAAVRQTDGYFDRLFDAFVNGMRLGMVIAICSVGLSLIFGTTGLTNFAQGELVTFGGIVGYVLSVTFGIPFLIAAPLTIALGGVLGWFLDFGLWAPLRRRGTGLVSQMVVSVGLALVLINFYLMRFGGSTRRYTAYNDQTAASIGPIDITPRDLTAGLVSLAAIIAVALMLSRSRLGKAMRAVSDNPDLASSTGIDSARIIRIVWILAGALTALGGIVRGLDEGVKADMGADLLFLMFAAITLGGLGSAYGALIGGFIIGIVVEVGTMGIPILPGKIPFLGWLKTGVPTELKAVPALFILILILLFRPQGILGSKERVG